MALIAILFSLVMERLLGSMEELRRFGWFLRYYHGAADRMGRVRWLNGPAGLLLLLLPLLVPVIALDYFLSGWWLLVWLPFSVTVLLYSYGPHDLEAEVEAFMEARQRGDEESACLHANELLGSEEVGNSAKLTQCIMENIFAEANERLLAIIFWFVLLGPAGALVYRLSSLLHTMEDSPQSELHEVGVRLHLLLAWLPARLCAVAYALAGSFTEAIHAWRTVAEVWPYRTRHLLIATGFGALAVASRDIEDDSTACEQIAEALALVRRSVLVFLSLIALLTLAGWMG